MFNFFFVYRLLVFKELEGFFLNIIFCEDMFYVVKVIFVGYQVVYVVDVVVWYFYNYKLLEEFKCYFDIGVFYV